jgi:hypothetical protein
MTKTTEQLVSSSYDRCLPLAERTSQFLNGLMIAVRPVLVELSDDPVIGEKSRGKHPTIRRAIQSTELEVPPTRVWQIVLGDEYESGKARSNNTLLTSSVDVFSDTWGGGRGARTNTSTLTWGFAKSNILYTGSDTWEGVGAYYKSDRDDVSRYRSADELREDYARAYTSRTASGLLVAQMVSGFSVANGGSSLDVEHIEAQAAELFEGWAQIDEAGAARALAPIKEIQPAA